MFLKYLPYLNRSDRRALSFLLTVAIIGIAAFYFFGDGNGLVSDAADDDSARIARSAISGQSSQGYSGYKGYGGYKEYPSYDGYQGYNDSQSSHSLFPFDPNTADSSALLRLGLKPWQVRNIYKYRAAGGVYSHPEDFARLYGLTKKQFEELRPYIRISDDYKPSAEFYTTERRQASNHDTLANKHYAVKLKAGQTIELNSADSAQLVRVPGIGPVYARQIETRRKWLGGYYSADQLLEIEYMPKEALNFFHVNPSLIKKLNVNKLSLSELKRHPYINYYQAKAIVDYRRMRGPLKNINELRLMKDFTEKDIERLKYYVEY